MEQSNERSWQPRRIESGKKIPFMPTKEELAIADSFKETAAGAEAPALALVDLNPA
jgi:hypothetical protein